jgi:mannosyltransferase OCH1-like enzyme
VIPRIIHQTWKTDNVPERWKPLQASWLNYHPSFEYRYWTDADSRAFVADHYLGYLPLFDGYALGVQRADLFRCLVMRHFGGIYVDMDFECLRPINPLLENRRLVFGLEPMSHAVRAPVLRRGLNRIVCNAFIASEARHPFWDFLLPRFIAARNEVDVIDATGPFLLTRACDEYVGADPPTIIGADLLYPVDNEEIRSAEIMGLIDRLQKAYAIHHWQGTWFRDAVISTARHRLAGKRHFPTDPQ